MPPTHTTTSSPRPAQDKKHSPSLDDKGHVFLVGGAVRDGLLGLEVRDKDFVVVGSTPGAMEAQGFKPVGKDFPVFLHPTTGEEYALARTERKSGHGYKGFTVLAGQDVTLHEDLGRRDLTINAMAQDVNGALFDPYGGKDDLQKKILRHVNPDAFVEDPVRVLRLARFAARYEGFSVAADTVDLAKSMVKSGEIDHLVAERVWQELAKGLMEQSPARMFEVLRSCNALQALIPELDNLWGIGQPPAHHPEVDTGIHVMMVLSQAAEQDAPLDVRWACLLHDLGKALTPKDILPSHHDHEKKGHPLVKAVCARLKVPAACKELAEMTCLEHTRIHAAMTLKPSSIIKLFERTDAIRRPERFMKLLQACECDSKGRMGLEDRPYPQKDHLTAALEHVCKIDMKAIVAQCQESNRPDLIPSRIYQARVSALKGFSLSEDDEVLPPCPAP